MKHSRGFHVPVFILAAIMFTSFKESSWAGAQIVTSATCEDSDTWYRAKTRKNCDWVSLNTDTRCSFMGDDGTTAIESCPVTCATCNITGIPIPAPTSAPYSYEYTYSYSYSYSYSYLYERDVSTAAPVPAPTPDPTGHVFAATTIRLNKTISCSTAGCLATATFDLTGWATWKALRLSIENLIGDFSYSTEYVDVYVGDSDIGVDCSSDNDCAWAYTCLTDFDISSYVSPGATLVTITLIASSKVNNCTPMMSADIILIVSRAGITPIPTASPILLPIPSPTSAPTPMSVSEPSSVATHTPTSMPTDDSIFITLELFRVGHPQILVSEVASLKQILISTLNVTASTIRNFAVESKVATRRQLLALYIWTVTFNIVVSPATTGSSGVFVDIDDQAMEDAIIESLEADEFSERLRSSLNMTFRDVYLLNGDDAQNDVPDDLVESDDSDEVSTAMGSFTITILFGGLLLCFLLGGTCCFAKQHGKRCKKCNEQLENGESMVSMNDIWLEDDDEPLAYYDPNAPKYSSIEMSKIDTSDVSSAKQNGEERATEYTKGSRKIDSSFVCNGLVDQPHEKGSPTAETDSLIFDDTTFSPELLLLSDSPVPYSRTPRSIYSSPSRIKKINGEYTISGKKIDFNDIERVENSNTILNEHARDNLPGTELRDYQS